jgi:hypothetical protein
VAGEAIESIIRSVPVDPKLLTDVAPLREQRIQPESDKPRA